MTRNQIAYWELQEKERSNRASEAIKDFEAKEGRRHNYVTEEQGQIGLALTDQRQQEQARHNRVSESNDAMRNSIYAQDIAEKARHNKAEESLGAMDLQERGRHNRRSETIDEMRASNDISFGGAINNLIGGFEQWQGALQPLAEVLIENLTGLATSAAKSVKSDPWWSTPPDLVSRDTYDKPHFKREAGSYYILQPGSSRWTYFGDNSDSTKDRMQKIMRNSRQG